MRNHGAALAALVKNPKSTLAALATFKILRAALALLNYKPESANVANVDSCISGLIFAVLVLM